MTVSRNKITRKLPFWHEAALITALSVVWVFGDTNTVIAQQVNPLTITTPAVQKQTGAAPSRPRMLSVPNLRKKKTAPPRPAPRSMTGGGVQIDSLSAINVNEAGVLLPSNGGFGVDMWKGTSASLVQQLLPSLPINAPSAAMRDLSRRLLLTPARLPEGEFKGAGLIAQRLSLLMAMGDMKGASDLFRSLPDVTGEPELVRLEMELRLLAYDTDRACSLASREMPINPSQYWKKAFNFCQIIQGQTGKAALGVSMMREMGEADEVFLQIAEALIVKEAPQLESLPNPSALHFAMAREANAPLPADVLSSNTPSVARAVATSSLASQGLRLEAAERADAAGALPKATLRQLYASVEFSEADRANPLSRADVEFGPMVRALLYHTALTQTVPTAKAEAAARAFALARDEGRYASTVQVFEPVLDRIPPSVDLKWFAPEAIRAFLVIGNFKSAGDWYQILRSRAGFDPEMEKALASFRPIAWLFEFEGTDRLGPEILADWWNAQKADPEAHVKAAVLYTILEALGLEVSAESWDPIINASDRKGVLLPNVGIWRRLQALAKKDEREVESQPQPMSWSAKTIPSDGENPASIGTVSIDKVVLSAPTATATPMAGKILATSLDNPSVTGERIGETVLLSLIAIGNAGPAKVDPLVLGDVLRALKAAGLKKEARALALDAVLARGL